MCGIFFLFLLKVLNTMDWSVDVLVSAYSQGYFPMPDPDNSNKVLWFRPNPRAVIPLASFHVSRSLRRKINKKQYTYSFNRCFRDVMVACGDREETWINESFLQIYMQMHQIGFAQSVEIWLEKKLVGGTYGVSLAGGFFAESMFHSETDCSKLALYHLVEELKYSGYTLLECQFLTPHLESLGAVEISDHDYIQRLTQALQVTPGVFGGC